VPHHGAHKVTLVGSVTPKVLIDSLDWVRLGQDPTALPQQQPPVAMSGPRLGWPTAWPSYIQSCRQHSLMLVACVRCRPPLAQDWVYLLLQFFRLHGSRSQPQPLRHCPELHLRPTQHGHTPGPCT